MRGRARSRLHIHRETLRALTSAALEEIRGGKLELLTEEGETNPKSNAWTGKVQLAAICHL